MDMPNPDTPLFSGPNTPEDRPGMDLPDDDVPQSDFPPVTGETFVTILWIGLLAVSGAGILITTRPKKRDET